MARRNEPEDAPATGNASWSACTGHDNDHSLRCHGFRIKHRRKHQEPIWEKQIGWNGEGLSWVEFSETDALARIGIFRECRGK